jgi:purine-binding chemotaxis protein CheW
LASTISPHEAAPDAAPGAALDAGAVAAADDDAVADRYLLFRLGGHSYACNIDVVREIVPFRRCTRLPGAPAYVCGLINLRGTLVTVLDLGVRLGGQPVNRNEGSVILVEQGTRVVGLGVDEMREVQRLAPGEIEAADAAVGGGPGGAAGAVRGIARVGSGVVVLLDVGSIIKQALL